MGKFSGDIAEDVKEVLQSASLKDLVDNPLVYRIAKKVGSAFTGAIANSHGDYDGTGNPYTLFTVTGDVILQAVWGIVNVSLTGASATVQVGVTGNTAAILALETATELDDGGVFVSATQAVGVAPIANSGAMLALNDGLDIIETLATANVDAGQIDYYCIWAPVEKDASIVAA